MLPGAGEAGVAHYVDDQLSRPDPLLFLKYMEYPTPHLEFYRQGLAALDRLSRLRHNSPFAGASQEQKVATIREISHKNPEGWNGPPAPLFYFVVRNDAINISTASRAARLEFGCHAIAERATVPVSSESKTFTSPAASTARPEVAITL